MTLCCQCDERPAQSGSVSWWLVAPLFLLLPVRLGGAYCKDCGAGVTTLALMVYAVIAVVAFVLAVIFW